MLSAERQPLFGRRAGNARTARNDLGWIPPEAMRFDLYKQD